MYQGSWLGGRGAEVLLMALSSSFARKVVAEEPKTRSGLDKRSIVENTETSIALI